MDQIGLIRIICVLLIIFQANAEDTTTASTSTAPTTATTSTATTSQATSTATTSSAATTATATATTVSANLVDKVFTGSGDSMVVKCASATDIGWFQRTWTVGGIREYYVNKGFKNSIDDCVQECAKQEECYFATMTSSRTCYLLTTAPNIESVHCRYLNYDHFGRMLDTCSIFRPCPSAYKICGKCVLVDVMKSYCKNKNKNEAVSKC